MEGIWCNLSTRVSRSLLVSFCSHSVDTNPTPNCDHESSVDLWSVQLALLAGVGKTIRFYSFERTRLFLNFSIIIDHYSVRLKDSFL